MSVRHYRKPSESMPRPTVYWFAEQMEAQLKANDHKGGWENLDIGYFSRRMDEELDELYAASAVLVDGQPPEDLDAAAAAVIREAADVANFAMMIADVARQRYAERTPSSGAETGDRQAAPGQGQ